MKTLSGSEKYKCLICEGTSFERIHSPVRGDKTGSSFIAQCKKCSHRQLHPKIYEIEHYLNDSQVNEAIEAYGTSKESYIDSTWLQAELRVKRSQNHKIIPEGREEVCIDIGGGYGFFSDILKMQTPHLKTINLEPSQKRSQIGASIYENKFNSRPSAERINEFLSQETLEKIGEPPKLITLWHVIEHLEEPAELLELAWNSLAPGGCISIEVPNSNDELLKLSPNFSKYFYMKEHIHYFSPDNLKNIIKKATNSEPEIYAYQRYGIFNYINWIEKNCSQGEHPDIYPGYDRFWLEQHWREHKERNLITDSLIANLRKPKK